MSTNADSGGSRSAGGGSGPFQQLLETAFPGPFQPVYTFLEETDLTNGYDKWNVIYGPWVYGPMYDDPWFTR